jgi:hypothetical protein
MGGMGYSGNNEQWSTRLGQCGDGIPAEHCLLSVFCAPCAMAKARSTTDKSHPLWSLLCWTPIGSYSYIRLGYGIKGECGEDCAKAIFCPCCTIRQAYTETETRGAIAGGHFAANNREWMTGSLFACSPMELCLAFFCPCYVAHNIRSILQPGADQWFDCCCILPTAMYGLVRNSYGLTSECPDYPCCEDICVGAVCFPCALARAQREAAAQKAAGFVGGMAQGFKNVAAGVSTALTSAAGKYNRV